VDVAVRVADARGIAGLDDTGGNIIIVHASRKRIDAREPLIAAVEIIIIPVLVIAAIIVQSSFRGNAGARAAVAAIEAFKKGKMAAGQRRGERTGSKFWRVRR